jgi:hypothetical protein
MVEFDPGAGEPWVQLDGAREQLDRFLDAFGRQLLDLLTAEKIEFVSSQVFWPFSTRQAAFGSYDQSPTTAESIGDEFGNFSLHCEDIFGQPVPPLGPKVGS